MKRFQTAAALLVLLGILSVSVSPAQEKMTNRSVLDLKSAGLGESIIHAKINAAPSVDFDVSTDALLELKNQDVSDGTIALMIERADASKKGLDFDLTIINSIEERDGALVLNGHFEIREGDGIKVFLPAFGSKDFVYVTEKKSGISFGTIAKAAGAATQGALAVGIGVGSPAAIGGALEVASKTASVGYAADAIDQIQSLPISKSAKKIAGKEMEVVGWGADDGGFSVLARLGKRRYSIQVREAVLLGEVKLQRGF